MFGTWFWVLYAVCAVTVCIVNVVDEGVKLYKRKESYRLDLPDFIFTFILGFVPFLNWVLAVAGFFAVGASFLRCFQLPMQTWLIGLVTNKDKQND